MTVGGEHQDNAGPRRGFDPHGNSSWLVAPVAPSSCCTPATIHIFALPKSINAYQCGSVRIAGMSSCFVASSSGAVPCANQNLSLLRRQTFGRTKTSQKNPGQRKGESYSPISSPSRFRATSPRSCSPNAPAKTRAPRGAGSRISTAARRSRLPSSSAKSCAALIRQPGRSARPTTRPESAVAGGPRPGGRHG